MDTSDKAGPENVVQRQLEAYNARDIDAFMAEWADDARYIAFPSTLLAFGPDEIRTRHVERFREMTLHARLVKRMVVGDLVVDQASVSRIFPGGPGKVDVIAIYEVRNGKIGTAWIKMGEAVLDRKP